MSRVRIFHACDAHGSENIWKKILKMGAYHKANVLLMLGDLTGKVVVPIIMRKENEWVCAASVDLSEAEKRRGKVQILRSRSEVESKKAELNEMGCYAFESTPEEAQELVADEKKVKDLMKRLMRETIQRWLDMASKEVPPEVMIISNPGNDDEFAIDDLIQNHDRVIYPLGKVVNISDRYQMISCAWVNPTPWQTPRECPENELKKKLEIEFKNVDNYENLICNFHAPPYNTTLDEAPKLDKSWRPITQFGMPITEHVGSKAVREVIESYQPLLGLHGHIHESCGFDKIGRTLCLNPGSEYRAGVLRGYVVDLYEDKVEFHRVEA